MRVLFWSEWFWPSIGGVERISQRLLTALRDRGHEIHVVTSQGAWSEEDEHEGLTIHRVPFQRAITGTDPMALIEARMRAAKLKKAIDPDIVHLAIIAPSVFFHLQTLDVCPCPTLLTRQDLLADPASGADTIFGRIVRSVDWIACCSRAMLDDTVMRIPEVTDRTSVVLNGIDPPSTAPAPLSATPPVIGVIGRLVPEKGVDVAISAMPMIRAAYPDARLVIAGGGPVEPALRELTSLLDLDAAVEFRGWVPPERVGEFMNETTLVQVPSNIEAFGLVALEAQQMGRPVVASNVGGSTLR